MIPATLISLEQAREMGISKGKNSKRNGKGFSSSGISVIGRISDNKILEVTEHNIKTNKQKVVFSAPGYETFKRGEILSIEHL